MTSHLGVSVSALVDGELDHGRRERVLGHLAHCPDCRDEVDAQRRFKAALRSLGGPVPAGGLSERLLAVAMPSQPAAATRPAGPGPRRGWPSAPAGRPSRAIGPGSRPAPRGSSSPAGRAAARRRHARLRRSAVGGALAALSLGGVLALGGPPPRGPVAPVDPTSASFVTDYVSSTNDVPFSEAGTLPVSLRSRP